LENSVVGFSIPRILIVLHQNVLTNVYRYKYIILNDIDRIDDIFQMTGFLIPQIAE